MANTRSIPRAYCPVHGFFRADVLSGFFNLSNAKNLGFEDCAVNCPKCGKSAGIVSGAYGDIPGVFEEFPFERLSPKVLAALNSIAKQVEKGKLTVEQAQDQAEATTPGAGKLFNVRDWSDTAKAQLYGAVLASMTALAIAALATRGGGNTTNNYYYSYQQPPAASEPVTPPPTQKKTTKGRRKFDDLKAGKIHLPKRKSKRRP